MARTTKALLEWMEEHHPRAAATLRDPASEAARSDARLPDALADLYGEHDGQQEGRMESTFFSDAFRWLPIAEALAARKMSTEVLEEVRQEFPEQEPFSPAWFPFAADLLGNYLVVDVEADDVFEHFHDEGRIEPGEPQSTAAFLAEYVDRLRSGDLVVDEKLGVISKNRPQREARRTFEPSPRRKALGIAGLVIWALGLIAFLIWLETSR